MDGKLKMPHITLRISDHLCQELELKAQELNIDRSTLLRDFIRKGLSSFQANHSANLDIGGLLKHNISYTMMVQCLMEMVVAGYVEKGSELCSTAHLKAEKLVNNLLRKLSKSSPESIDLVKFKNGLETEN